MRADPLLLSHLLAQISDQVSYPPLIAGAVALITALGAIVGPPLRDRMRAKAEREAADAKERSEQRRAKHEAELEQTRVFVRLAEDVPRLTAAIEKDRVEREKSRKEETDALVKAISDGFYGLRESNAATVRAVEANTRAVDALLGELHSERDETIRQIAEQVGANSQRAALKSRPDVP